MHYVCIYIYVYIFVSFRGCITDVGTLYMRLFLSLNVLFTPFVVLPSLSFIVHLAHTVHDIQYHQVYKSPIGINAGVWARARSTLRSALLRTEQSLRGTRVTLGIRSLYSTLRSTVRRRSLAAAPWWVRYGGGGGGGSTTARMGASNRAGRQGN